MPKSTRPRLGRRRRGAKRLRRTVTNSPLPPAISPLNPPGSILPAGLKRVQAAYQFSNFPVSTSNAGWNAQIGAVTSPISINNIYDPLILSGGELTSHLDNKYRPAVGHDVYAQSFDEYVVVSAKVTAEIMPLNTNADHEASLSLSLCPTMQEQGPWESTVEDYSNLVALGYPVKDADKDLGGSLKHSVSVSMKNLFEQKESIANAGDDYAGNFTELTSESPVKSAYCMLVLRNNNTLSSVPVFCNMRLKIEYLLLPRGVKVPPVDLPVMGPPNPPPSMF